MADKSVEIPNRAAFKASEVCEIAQIPPYVLRSWEKEFPRLGAVPRPGGPRIYTRSDIEQILHIKQLVFAEGLTLAGARRRLEGEPPAEEEPLPLDGSVPDAVKARVAQAKRELRLLLDMLSQPGPVPAPAPSWPPAAPARSEGATERHPERATVPQADEALPLWDGVPEAAPKTRRPRRPVKGGRGGGSSNVE